MGVFKGYQIEWINALTGAIIDTTEKISDIYGHLKLQFPGTLTGNVTAPILFFKLYRTDSTFLAPIPSNEFETALPQEFQLAEDLNPIDPTAWRDSVNNSKPIFSVSPNPSLGLVNCTVSGKYLGLNRVLTNSYGQQLAENKIQYPNFTVDLSVYSSGNFYLKTQDINGKLIQTKKIIKQ